MTDPFLFKQWLDKSLNAYLGSDHTTVKMVLDSFDLVNKGELPSLSELSAIGGYDAIVISGSRHTAFEDSPSFIPRLIDFLQEVCTDSQYQHLRILGICFGMQCIARALGGQVERGDQGWEMGVYQLELSTEGQKWFTPAKDGRVHLQQLHRDRVSRLPPDFIPLLSSAKYPIHGMIKYHESEADDGEALPHIMGLQGHPEIPSEMVQMAVNARHKAGVVDDITAVESLSRAYGVDGAGGQILEGVWKFLL